MAVKFNLGFVLVFVATWNVIASNEELCPKNFDCIPLSKCGPNTRGNILFPCHNGLNLVCCRSKLVRNDTNIIKDSRKTAVFPVECGVVNVENKITYGQEADVGQFPWMALLGYKQRTINYTEFLCGGTLITEKFVLTAAHCIPADSRRELVLIRLGEHDLRTPRDCYFVGKNVTVCADPHVDVPVEHRFIHPQFNSTTLKNDIALLTLKKSITFTKFIRPICLPFERNLETKNLTGDTLLITGWGKTNSKNVGGSSELQYAFVRVWNQDECNNAVPPEVRNLSNRQLCANGEKEDACKGDSGGPLSNITVGVDGEFRSCQIGIVSFASTISCGIKELPPVYTRVDKYLEWIVKTVLSII